MESKFIELIFEGKYTKAEEIIMKISSSEQREMIMNLAYETESVSVYSFLRYMIEKYKTQFWLELTIDVMINPLCFIKNKNIKVIIKEF